MYLLKSRGRDLLMEWSLGRAVRKRMLEEVVTESLTLGAAINSIKVLWSAFIYREHQSFSLVLLFLELGGPESKVVSDQLHDGGGILVLVFLDLINVGNGVIEGLLGELAGF